MLCGHMTGTMYAAKSLTGAVLGQINSILNLGDKIRTEAKPIEENRFYHLYKHVASNSANKMENSVRIHDRKVYVKEYNQGKIYVFVDKKGVIDTGMVVDTAFEKHMQQNAKKYGRIYEPFPPQVHTEL